MSDQDFFFDEEESTPSPKASAKSAAAKTAPKAAAQQGQQLFQQSVSMTVASLIAVIALLLGVIIGFLIPKAGPSLDTTGTGALAPQLTPEQLQSGQLPPGHPDIGGMMGGQTTTGATEGTATGK